MPRTNECDFCGGDIEPGTGTMFVRTDGSTVHFCSSKCEKNADLGRRARDLEWTEEGEETAVAAGGSEAAETPDVEESEEVEAAAEAATEPGEDESAEATADGDAEPAETVEDGEADDDQEEEEAEA